MENVFAYAIACYILIAIFSSPVVPIPSTPLTSSALQQLHSLLTSVTGAHTDGERDRGPWRSTGARNVVDRLLNVLAQGGTLERISKHDWSSMWSNQTANLVTRDDPIQSRCYKELGCISYTSRWYHSVYRPVNMFPLEPHIMNVSFLVYNRRYPKGNVTVELGNNRALIESGVDCKKLTKFIIHGFLDTAQDVWVKEMASRLLRLEDLNVFAVDWRTGALPMYQQAVANTRLVAMQISHFIKWLQKEHGLNLLDVHLIGHSLGAHTAGYVGSNLKTIGRISGLDPAQPGFQYLHKEVRLDRNDAKFVDVIHTDGRGFLSGGFGMIEPCGHLDFYPNGGVEQPGCSSYSNTLSHLLDGSVDDMEAELFACRHVKSIRFYSESLLLRDNCQFLAIQCKSYNDFLEGKCTHCGGGEGGHFCAPMGFFSDQAVWKKNTSIRLYTTTAAQKPYCLNHYMLEMQLSDSQDMALSVSGKMAVSIYGSKKVLERYVLQDNDIITVERGSVFRFLVRTHIHFGQPQAVHIYWRSNRLLPCLLWCSQHNLIVRSVTVTDMNQYYKNGGQSVKMCSPDGEAVIEPMSSPAIFSPTIKC